MPYFSFLFLVAQHHESTAAEYLTATCRDTTKEEHTRMRTDS